jgi:hypothetical protein
MFRIIFGGFILLHGVVHLIYAGQSARIFELQPGLEWPDNSWLFSRWVGKKATRIAITIACIFVVPGFGLSGVGFITKQPWVNSFFIITLGISTLIFLLGWDGKFEDISSKGGLGILINLGMLAIILTS